MPAPWARFPPLIRWARVPGATLTNNASFAGGSQPATWNAGNLGAAVPAGAKIIVCCVFAQAAAAAPTVTSLVDSLGNIYTKDLLTTYIDGTVGNEMSVWSAVSNGGVPGTLTAAITWANANGTGMGLAAIAYTGLLPIAGSIGIDISSIANYGGVASGTSDSGVTTGRTKRISQLKLGFYVDDGANSTLTPGTVDTAYASALKMQASGNAQILIEEADAGPQWSTAQAKASTSVNAAWGAAVAVYKLAGVPA